MKNLLQKYLTASITSGEQEQLNRLLRDGQHTEELRTFLDDFLEDVPIPVAAPQQDKQASATMLLERIRRERRAIPRWMRAAAVVAVLILTAAVLFLTNRQQPRLITAGGQGAILTLADGSQVVLDSLADGIIAHQSGAQVSLQNGHLSYGAGSGEAAYNVMSVPKGRQFRLTLPDGTGVWLNSASSIRFPTAFKGRERRVEIKGEAYLEIARNADMPFHVSVNGQTDIEVLGTSFNINAYDNEPAIAATLLEGSIKVNGVILKPGQQARINGKMEIVNHVNIEKVTAWKNGFFNFSGASLQEVMRQLERWYDISVVYEKGIPDISFSGEISKDVSLKELLVILDKAEVRFRLEGHKLIVMQ